MDSVKPPRKQRAMGAPMRARRITTHTAAADRDTTIADVTQVDTAPVQDEPVSDLAADPFEESQQQTEAEASKSRPSRKERRAAKKAARAEKGKVRRWFTWRKIVLYIALIVLAIGGFYAYKVFAATRKIFSGKTQVAAALTGDTTKLKGEGDGRVNIALLGIGGDNHDGGTLSDTIMVVSLDVKNKDVAMVSIPRDLYVPIPGYGSAKINSAHAYGIMYKYPGGGGALAEKTLQKNLGVPINYYARIDFEGFKKAIDVVGGVDITVKQSLYDPEYPCDNNQYRSCGFKISPGQYHMNGSMALKYARCRKGNCGDDYGRAARQQEVLLALRQKALSLGTLSNPAKVASLIDIVGNHFVTDLQFNEIKKLISLGKDIDKSKITSKVLTNNPNDGTVPLVQNGFIGGASVVIPTAGVGNFTAIQAFMRSLFADSYLKSENAKIEIQNGTSRAGLAGTTATLLKSYQYNIVAVNSADNANYATTQIIDYSNGKKPITFQYLEHRFGVKAVKVTTPAPSTPATATSTTSGAAASSATVMVTPDIRIIIGRDYQGSN